MTFKDVMTSNVRLYLR